MKLEDTSGPLRELGEWLFEFLRELAGEDGGESVFQKAGGWYRAPGRGKVCLYFYLVGPKGKQKHTQNSIHLATIWDDEFQKFPFRIEQGNNYFGKTSADFYARTDDRSARKHAEHFIRHAFRAVAVSLYSKKKHDEKDRLEFAKKVTDIAENTPQAKSAASWINGKLPEVGMAMASTIKQILINVASEAVKKIIMGG